MRFFRPNPACDSRGCLHLTGLSMADGTPLDPFRVIEGEPLAVDYLRYEGAGNPAVHDWNWGFGLVPVVRQRVAGIIQEAFASDVQVIPVTVPSVGEPLVLLNIVSIRDCVDEARSRASRIKPGEGAAEHVGRFRDLGCLTIDASRVDGADIFRLRGAEVSAVVTERVRDLARAREWTGVDFLQTYDGCPPGAVIP